MASKAQEAGLKAIEKILQVAVETPYRKENLFNSKIRDVCLKEIDEITKEYDIEEEQVKKVIQKMYDVYVKRERFKAAAILAQEYKL